LLDLEELCSTLDLTGGVPRLLTTLLELTDGKFYLPPRSVILGIRRNSRSRELKVELISNTETSPAELIARINRLLEPTAKAAFRTWTEALHPSMPDQLQVSIISVKISDTQPLRLSVYAREPRIYG
jgi:hypothetical protein